nr:glycine--tRNA ligase subunit beta [Sphingomicrobium nitratireducens]
MLELFSEEIPARMQAQARADLERLFRAQLDAAGLKADGITTYSTPRRLALIATGLPEQTQAVSEEAKGPPEGAPDQAVEGFCRKNGVTRDQLEVRDVKGRATYFAVIDKPGRASADILGPAIAAIVRDFPWPKSMRWGPRSASSESLRWVRPLHRIVAILGESVVPVDLKQIKVTRDETHTRFTNIPTGISSGAATLGHRFHHPGEITIGGAHDYVEKLRACHVLVDHEERQDIVRKGAADAAARAGHELIEDEGLVIENAGLTEWPVPLLGSFDPAFLDVPEEVIQLTARLDQKYFVMRGKDGRMAPNFVLTSNIDSKEPDAVVAGNERVLAARLSDARFFWENDLKVPLASLSPKLGDIVFHEKLGTLAAKVERVARLARWMAEEGIVKADPDAVERAARLAKNDLVTGMVGEFPELQGIIGGHLARAQGEPDAIADAVRDHYKPVGQGDDVPTAPVTVAVSLADKLDTLVSFFAVDLPPTGSKDPFALRRAALAVIRQVLETGMRASLAMMALRASYHLYQQRMDERRRDVARSVIEGLTKALGRSPTIRELQRAVSGREAQFEHIQFAADIRAGIDPLLDFFADRLKVQQKEAGIRHDLIDAVFALGGEDDLVRLLARVEALQSFMDTDDGANLHAAYKRAANILKKEGVEGQGAIPGTLVQDGEEDPLALVDQGQASAAAAMSDPDLEPAERALADALVKAGPVVTQAIGEEDFTRAMGALASIRQPIDAFFDDVTVNDEDAGKRKRRLGLLARFRALVNGVADFSKIEG